MRAAQLFKPKGIITSSNLAVFISGEPTHLSMVSAKSCFSQESHQDASKSRHLKDLKRPQCLVCIFSQR